LSPAVLPVVEVAGQGTGEAAEWLSGRRAHLDALVADSGMVLLRGLPVTSAADVAAVATAVGIEPMVEREGFAPRSTYAEAVYSATMWPSDEPMCMHHELSYASEVPGRIVFGCLKAARTGRTRVADGHAVLKALPPDLVDRFAANGWLLTRAYHDAGIPWSTAFGTEDQAQVAAYCAAAGIDHEWLPDGQLRTRQHRAAVVRHPGTGVPVWFNQAAFLNERTLDPVIRDYLVSVYGQDGLPFNTACGDGTPISAETVSTINEVYLDASVDVPWQDGDVVILDNFRLAHGREPYEGEREIVVILGDPVRLS
jgi:Taurine catabolism dioxygenase TauD, TfdA family